MTGPPARARPSGRSAPGRGSPRPPRRPLALALLVACAALLALLRLQGGGATELIALDVGQGDATLLRTPGGRTALIDGGKSGTDLVATLAGLGVERLDLVVATHADFDHIGGLDAAIDGFGAALFLDNGLPHPTAAYDDLLAAVERAGARVLEPSRRVLTLDGVEIEVLPPLGRLEPGADEQNENSIGLVVRVPAGDAERAGFAALLPGDAPSRTQQAWLGCCAAALRGIDVYRAAHHGARTGDAPAFVRGLAPELVIVSAGEGNAYGHPHPEALAAYASAGARVLRTDRDGPVVVRIAADGGWEARAGTPQPADGPAARLEELLRALLDGLGR